MSQAQIIEVVRVLREANGNANPTYRNPCAELADRIQAHGIAPPDNFEAEIHKIAKKYMTKRNQGRFMGDIRAMLAAAPKQEVKP